MGGVCCANERDKDVSGKSQYSEMSSTHKVRITFHSQSQNDFNTASTNNNYDD